VTGKCLHLNDESADVKNDHSGVDSKACSFDELGKCR